MSEETVDQYKDVALDTSEGDEPSEWEKRFEAQVNTFFDESIARVPGFVDRNLKSFKKVMSRSLGPRTGVADIFVSLRNVASGVSKTVGGPDFSTSTYTDDRLRESFEREVVSPDELESLLRRLFTEFEEAQWSAVADERAQRLDQDPEELEGDIREQFTARMEGEINHDPLLAQAIRSGVKLGLPATLGYVLFGKVTWLGFGSDAAGEIYKSRLNFYNQTLMKLGRFKIPGWVGAVGLAGSVLGTLAAGGIMEFAVNNVRDIKGAYIRQLNSARHALLYGEDTEHPEGLLHLVRGLERQFERLPHLDESVLDEGLDEGLVDDVDAVPADTDAS